MSGPPLWKGPTRKQLKARRKRKERAVVRDVRARCVERDGYCILRGGALGPCEGPSEWAHFGEHKRFKTVRQEAEERHTTAGSFMACRRHHDQYDGRRKPRLVISAPTSLGCDGALVASDGTTTVAVPRSA
jgi:hypothetical protein